MSSAAIFKFDKKLIYTIDRLKYASGASSRAEIIRRSIALFKVVQDAQANGEKLILRSVKNVDGKTTDRVVVIS